MHNIYCVSAAAFFLAAAGCQSLALAAIFVAASTVPAGWAAGIPDPEAPVAARNILFIVGDDSSAQVLGCYGNPLIRTPNLDRLASGGTRFDRAYCNSPVCTPSRQSMITGKLPRAAAVTLLQSALAEDQLTIAEHLKRFGFKTGAVGKMHFNSQLKHGFDYGLTRLNTVRISGSILPRPSGRCTRETALAAFSGPGTHLAQCRYAAHEVLRRGQRRYLVGHESHGVPKGKSREPFLPLVGFPGAALAF